MTQSTPPLLNLYPQITSFSSLLTAFRKAGRGKRYRPELLAFAANLEAELFRLQHELRSFTYAPGPYRQHPSPSEPLEGIPAGAQEGSRPAPEIGSPIRTILARCPQAV